MSALIHTGGSPTITSSEGSQDEFEMYLSGSSIPEVSIALGIPLSTLRFRFKKAGILRSRAEGIKIAASKGRQGAKNKGRSRTFSQEWKDNIRRSAIERGKNNSAGIRVTPSGYSEFTRGPHKAKSVHVYLMERRIGRTLFADECVHHIDGDKTNNNENNLALVTRSGHSRLHRLQDSLSGNERERLKNGRFS